MAFNLIISSPTTLFPILDAAANFIQKHGGSLDQGKNSSSFYNILNLIIKPNINQT
jgi:hypothetical protein